MKNTPIMSCNICRGVTFAEVAVTSLVHKRTGRDWVESADGRALGQYLNERFTFEQTHQYSMKFQQGRAGHDTYKYLPMPAEDSLYGYSGQAKILPFIEQANLQALIDFSQPLLRGSANAPIVNTAIAENPTLEGSLVLYVDERGHRRAYWIHTVESSCQ